MLAYFLAITATFIGVTLYLTAFFRPRIHRQDDFLWSGLALFYALILWLCAGRITGALLLGQLAITIIAIAFIWENRQLRQAITNSQDSNQALEGFSILSFILTSLTQLPKLAGKKVVKPAQPTSSIQNKSTTQDITKPTKVDETSTSEKLSPELPETNVEINDNSQAKSPTKTEIVEPNQEIINSSSAITDELEVEAKETTEEISEVQESLENIEQVLQDKRKVSKLTLTQKETKVQMDEDEGELPIVIDIPDDDEDDNKSEEKGNILSKLWGGIRNLLPLKKKNNLDFPSSTTESVVADLPDSGVYNEDITASEVESAITNFELDNNNGKEKQIDKTSQVIETEEYTDIVEEENLTKEESLNLDDNTSEYQIESNVSEDEELVIDVDDTILDKKNSETKESQPQKIEDNILSELNYHDNQLIGENSTTETKTEESTFPLNEDIDFDSKDVPKEETIDSLTDLHLQKTDSNEENKPSQ